MRKIIFAGLLVSAAVMVIASFFLPKKFVVEKATDVAAPASYLYEEVNNLERWPLWSYWFDETSEITYGDSRVGMSASSNWKNRKGTGNVTVIAHDPNAMVRVTLEFGPRGAARYEFQFVPDSLVVNKTRLILKAEVTGPGDNSIWSRWKRFLLANRIASSITHNMASLRRIAETKPVFDNVTEELLAPSYYVSVRKPRRQDSVTQQIRLLYSQIVQALNSAGSNSAGPPFCLVSDSTIEFAVPIEPDARIPSSYPVSQLYSGRVIRGTDYGSYDDIDRTHHEVQRYIQYKDYMINGTPWEVYVTNPNEDPSSWTTEVYYPITTKEEQGIL